MTTLSNDLNPQQKQAVEHGEGPLMVVAGAGSGKTRVITSRIVHLIRDQGIPADAILAITFTNKAANEMKERVRDRLGHSDSFPWISTFHSFCLRVLRRHIAEMGMPGDFAIYDTQDQLALIKQCMKSASIPEEGFPPKTLLNHISGFKNDFLLPRDIDRDALPYGNKFKAAEVYPLYQEGLKKNNALDFDDLLLWAVRLFQEKETIRDLYNSRFQHILVDEFQDTNLTQYKLLRLLTQKHRNICVVGDDDQSIYRWRGANLENILHFEKDYPGTVVIHLEENYRSTQTILEAAGGVVRENVNRKPKTLWTRNEKGPPVVYYRAENETDEARAVCDRVLKLHREESLSLSDMAVLYRTNAQSRILEETLRGMGIPYQVFGGQKFYARKEIKDVLAYLRVVLNPGDSVSLKRIVNIPARGIGKTSLDKIDAYCQENQVPFLEGLRKAEADRLTSPAVGRKISRFVEMMDEFAEIARNRSPLDLLHEVVDRTGYLEMLRKEDTMESRGRIENLQELFSALEQSVEQDGSGLQEFLDSASLVTDIDSMEDSRGILPLMTLHTCKGLEFQAVFIVGMEDGLLPHNSSMSDSEEYEEERRLCYVGFTRAKHFLFLSNARLRRIYGSTFNYNPSSFLLSIPSEVLVKQASPSSQSNERPNPSGKASWAMRSELPPDSSVGSDEPYGVGTRVLHPKFGQGVVIRKMGNAKDLKVEIFFKQPHGKKKIAVNHVKLIPL